MICDGVNERLFVEENKYSNPNVVLINYIFV